MERAQVTGTGHKRILVIEDSRTQALHLQSLLESEGAAVLLAFDGPSGVQQAQETWPDVIILDMRLPGMNGLEVYERLRQTPPTAQTPVIMMTGLDDAGVASLGLDSELIDYIPKDAFADAVLLETLRQMGLLHSRSMFGRPS